jgi:hypothetical protein
MHLDRLQLQLVDSRPMIGKLCPTGWIQSMVLLWKFADNTVFNLCQHYFNLKLKSFSAAANSIICPH